MRVGETPIDQREANGPLRIKKVKELLKRCNFKGTCLVFGIACCPADAEEPGVLIKEVFLLMGTSRPFSFVSPERNHSSASRKVRNS